MFEFNPGVEIGDKYVLKKVLGSGGFGMVWLAGHKFLPNKFVAIKFGLNLMGDAKERFENEIQILDQLRDNPNIIKVEDAGNYGPYPYLVLEFATAGDLDKYILQNPPTLDAIAGWLKQLAHALDYAHSKGIVHRDLKPANILFMRDGSLRLCDFGIAHDDSHNFTVSGYSMGTPEYMAPEQIVNLRGVGPQTDTWALGVIALKLITGKPLFDAKNVGSLVEAYQAVTNATVPKLTTDRSGATVPPPVQQVIARALEKDPQIRRASYPTVTAFAEAFARAIAPQPVQPAVNNHPFGQPPPKMGKPLPKPNPAYAQTIAASPKPVPVPPPPLLESERNRLLLQLTDQRTSYERRCAIGGRLNEMGDTRPGVGVRADGLPDIRWLPVTPGGNINIKGTAFLVQPFYIAKYPITNAQFDAFVKAWDGYYNREWWRDMPAQYQPRKLDNPYNSAANNSRDSISWYQSVALARWLHNRWRGYEMPAIGSTSFEIGRNAVVRLPTEWEWQWAAQGGQQQRKYPWGEWRSNKANTDEAGLEQAIAVGMYPDGVAACKAQDMAGNVWEWCLNKYQKPGEAGIDANWDYRVLRGGSFHDNQPNAAAASRSHYSPRYDFDSFGLRLVVAAPI